MRSQASIVVAVVMTMALGGGAAWGEDTFTHVYITETTETVDLGNDVTVDVFENHGFIVADDPANRLHMANQDCYGTGVGTAEAGESAGYCTLVPTSGDGGLWISWQGDQAGGTWTVLRSTGSLQGASGSGTFGPSGQWPDGKGRNWVKGTFKLP
jgi:hypothetical protein